MGLGLSFPTLLSVKVSDICGLLLCVSAVPTPEFRAFKGEGETARETPQTANLTNPKNPNCGSSVGSNLFVAQVLFCSKVICSSMCGSCNIVFSSAWDYRRFLPIPVVSDRPKMFWTNQCLSDLSEALGFLSVNFMISYWRKYLFSPFDRKLVTDFSLFSNDP